MARATDDAIGTRDLENGMRASRAAAFATILVNVVLVLAVFNSPGLVGWTQRLPSSPASAWLAERAADWDRMMHVAPAEVLETLRKRLKVEVK